MWKEFKAFLIKDNVIGLAIAVILGGTLNKLVGSVVDDLIMPLVNVVTATAGGGRWEQLMIGLPGSTTNPATGLTEGPAIRIGLFLAALVNFFIIGLVCWRIAKAFVNKG
ncbi:MAG TPA: MscL family protein [Gemmatimonadaceae bacterium]|jgi:large conductance mechanosensitive channel